MFVKLKHKDTNEIIQAKIGFSWTMFFFGAFVPLFRGDWKWFLIMLIMLIASGFTLGLFIFVFCFLYNGIYIKEKLMNGWEPLDVSDAEILKQKQLYFK